MVTQSLNRTFLIFFASELTPRQLVPAMPPDIRRLRIDSRNSPLVPIMKVPFFVERPRSNSKTSSCCDVSVNGNFIDSRLFSLGFSMVFRGRLLCSNHPDLYFN